MKNNTTLTKKTYLYASAKHYGVQPDGSFSIQGQHMALTQYVEANRLENWEFVYDLGYSQVDFTRLALNRVISDVKAGNVSAVIVQDLSRLARDFRYVSSLSDNLFTEYNTCLVVLNNPDFENRNSFIEPFRKLLREFARETACRTEGANGYKD